MPCAILSMPALCATAGKRHRTLSRHTCYGDQCQMSSKYKFNCAVCGKTFVTTRKTMEFCGPICERRGKILNQRRKKLLQKGGEEALREAMKACDECGELFLPINCSQRVCYPCGAARHGKTKSKKAEDVYDDPRPTRLCTDCKTVYTWDYRCPECWEKHRKKHPESFV